jgi:hypothetical protein
MTKPDIVGARIIDVHSTFQVLDGYECTTIYFTVDRGFSFILPIPGFQWERIEVPPTAERLPDGYLSKSYKVEGSWPSVRFIPEPPTKNDVIRRIKERTIQGVYCRKMDEDLGFYEPDDSLLLFDDGSQASCVTVAPHGTGATGLHFRTDVGELPKIRDLVDFFEVPIGRGQSCPLDRASSGLLRSFPESSGHGSRRQKQPAFRQHFWKRLPDPHGQRSFLPSFSVNSLPPWTTRTPRFTFVSEGKPLRRLLIVSKKMAVRQNHAGP